MKRVPVGDSHLASVEEARGCEERSHHKMYGFREVGLRGELGRVPRPLSSLNSGCATPLAFVFEDNPGTALSIGVPLDVAAG